jgi:hypothetical protein
MTDISKEIDDLIGSLASETPNPSLETPVGDPTPPTTTPPPKDVKTDETTPSITPDPEGKKDETIPDDKGGAPAPKSDDGTPAKEVTISTPTLSTEGGEETREELQERVKLLLSHIESITTVPPLSITPVMPKADEKVKEDVPTSSSTKDIVETIDFLGDKSIDDLIDNKDQLNSLLNQIYAKARADAKEDAAKAILSALPNLIDTRVKDVNNTDAIVNDFYKANEDLVLVRNTVKHVLTQVHAEKPDLAVPEALKEAADRTRKLLGIKRTVKNTKFNDPAFVDPNSTKKKTVSSTGIQKEIDEILTY